LYYYQEREHLGQNPVDQTHQFDLWLDHAFTPRWEARLQDSVVVAQDPALLTPGAVTVAQKVSGNNIVNHFTGSLHTDWTRLFSTMLTYQNTATFYDSSGAIVTGWPLNIAANLITFGPYTGDYVFPPGSPPAVTPSYAGSLNRVEQSASLDFQWHISPNTMALIGYKFGLVNFTGDELIAFSYATILPSPPFSSLVIGPPTPVYSNNRDNYSHYVYLGVQHAFLENLVGSANVGVQYTDYYKNVPSASSSFGPYADASLIYTYAAGSYIQVGLTQSRNESYTVSEDANGRITLDQETTVIYGSINHPLTPKLLASAVGHIQYSAYHQGQFNSQSAYFYSLGANLSYNFTHHLSSELGYNFDYYTTAVPGQDYTRNRIYLGVTAGF
jgi:hypothetical protein